MTIRTAYKAVVPPNHRRFACWALSVSITACSTTATIERRDGPPTEGFIVRSEQDTLYLRDDQDRPFQLDRRQVADIDHPGNVLMAVGGAIGLLFLPFLVTAPTRKSFDVPAWVYGTGVAGWGMFAWGTYCHTRSVNAARAYESGPRYLRFVPKAPPPRDSTTTTTSGGGRGSD